ncbi:hypothetical protein L204_101167 [Cryptococcus depauperatus]|nr:hypothetical protein L204_00901 [Cryptococcus depauperatus CBS 7855]
MASLIKLLSLLPLLALTQAATADEWRSRSIYQLMTDRFAPPADNTPCELGARNYCGGTWQTIISKLDYIQALGFDAIWISPTALNLEGDTEYGQAYHGYWTTDPTKLNPHFGTDADLKALSKAVHSRGMYLMTDIAINHLASTTYSLSVESLKSAAGGALLFKDPADYHPRCGIQWGNQTSEQVCWLAVGDNNNGVALMDLKTESESVAGVLTKWISGYVAEYGVDGFRVDATKHMSKEFQHNLCAAADSFCMGEVAGDDSQYAGSFQGPDGIQSVCGFSMMYAMIEVFAKGKSTNTLDDYMKQAAENYYDPTLISLFLDNQDQPRFNSLTSDRALAYNAIVMSFMYGGMPVVYYGLEQDISDGSADPANREALWNYNNYATTGETFKRIANLNKIRSSLGKIGNFHKTVGKTLALQKQDIAIQHEEALIILTNRGGSGQGTWTVEKTQLGKSADVIDLLSCAKSSTDSNGSLKITFSGGQPSVWVTTEIASKADLCNLKESNSVTTTSQPISTSPTASGDKSTTNQQSTTVTSSGTGATLTGGTSSVVAINYPVRTDVNSDTSATATETGTCKRSRKRNAMML